MVPSQRAVEEALLALSPGEFQQLAETYMAIEYAGRFARSQILGRNSRGQTTTGWPDAYAVLPDGRIDALEATADVRNWTRHLDSDLKKAATLPDPGLGGLAFLTTARTPLPSTLISRRRRLAELGVAGDRQTFVFRQDLVKGLCRGRFASIWGPLLSLPVSPFPFTALPDASFYGTGEAGQFMPSVEEYAQGLVTRAPVLERVSDRLARSGVALLEGRGASGKTALGGCLGWERILDGRPVYYLDLADEYAGAPEFIRGADEAIVSRGDRGVLFILDNVHQNAASAAELHRSWSAAENRSQLLLLSRQAESAAVARGIKSPLAELEESALLLTVGRELLCGVFNRLRRRRDLPEIEVPSAVQKHWLKLFGGDLIAFGAALALADPRPPDWELSPTAARIYLHDRYLKGLEAVEQRDLCLVADRSALELSTPEEMLTPGSLDAARESGILEHRDGRVRTVHPGIGELILAAAGAEVGDFAVQFDLGDEQSPEEAAITARRLLRGGRTAAAAVLVRRLHALGLSPFRILATLGPGSTGERLQVLRVLLGAERLEDLLGSNQELTEFVLNASVRELTGFDRAARSLKEPLRRNLRRVLHRELEAGSLDLKRYAREIIQAPIDLPLILRYLTGISKQLYETMLPLLVRDGAITACLTSAPGFQKRRWADLLEASTANAAVADAMAITISTHPDVAARHLLYRGKGLERIASAGRVPSIRRAMIAAVRSNAFHQVLEEELLDFGIRKFRCAIELTSAHDPNFLGHLDAQADVEALARRRAAWPRGQKARERALAVTADRLPRVHAALLE
jgi:hypothetical protein